MDWNMVIALSAFGAFLLAFAQYNRGTLKHLEDRLNDRMDGVETRLNDRMDGVENRLNTRIDRLEADIKSLRDLIVANKNT